MDTSSFFQYGDEVDQPAEVVFMDGCGAIEWSRVLEYTTRIPFRKGDIVIEQGQRDRVLLIVLEGQLETVVGTGRRRRRLAANPPGSVIGELGFLDGRVRSANVVAETDGELLMLPFTAFEAMAEAHPQVAHRMLLDLARILASRLRTTTTRLETGGN